MNAQNGRKGEATVDFDFDFGSDPKALDLSGKIHQLPCTIKFDGPCPVSHYFKPKSTGNALIFAVSSTPLYIFSVLFLFFTQ